MGLADVAVSKKANVTRDGITAFAARTVSSAGGTVEAAVGMPI